MNDPNNNGQDSEAQFPEFTEEGTIYIRVPKGADPDWLTSPDGLKEIMRHHEKSIAEGSDSSGENSSDDSANKPVQASREPSNESDPPKPSQADNLVRIAHSIYTFGVTPDGEAFAVLRKGPNVALMIKAGKTSPMQASLAHEYRRRTGKTASSTALYEAMITLAGEAMTKDPQPVELRIAEHDEGLLIDLGGLSGQAIVVRPGRWDLADRSPVPFKRNALTAPLPIPTKGGDLTGLRDLLNVSDATWPLLRGWLVASLFPSIAHPVLMLGGEQGTGKSTAARMIMSLFDPTTALLRTVPGNAENWVMSASGSWGVCIDNVSSIQDWWSDALCKAVTGDGWVKRRNYTDNDLMVLDFRRVVMMTSIDAGAMRGDLGDRLLLVDLEPIDDANRRSETELMDTYRNRHAELFGGLLDLLAKTLEILPEIQLATLPRMADFAKVLAAIDRVLGEPSSSLGLYLHQRTRIAEDVVESDAVASAVRDFMRDRSEWSGPLGALLSKLDAMNHGEPGPGALWPRTPRKLTSELKRVSPALLHLGIRCQFPRPGDKTRTYHLSKRTTQPPEQPNLYDNQSSETHPECPSGGSGGLGGLTPPIPFGADQL